MFVGKTYTQTETKKKCEIISHNNHLLEIKYQVLKT